MGVIHLNWIIQVSHILVSVVTNQLQLVLEATPFYTHVLEKTTSPLIFFGECA